MIKRACGQNSLMTYSTKSAEEPPGHPLAILSGLEIPPARAVLVGDHSNDVRAARAAGIAPVFAAWGYGPPAMAQGAPVATAPADLPALLAGALPA